MIIIIDILVYKFWITSGIFNMEIINIVRMLFYFLFTYFFESTKIVSKRVKKWHCGIKIKIAYQVKNR